MWQDEDDDWYATFSMTGHTSTVWDFAFDKTGDKIGISTSFGKKLRFLSELQ